MAEINVNQVHSHTYERYERSGSVDVITSINFLFNCTAGHHNCRADPITLSRVLRAARRTATSGELPKRTGEINANPRHSHSYVYFNGTHPRTALEVDATTCPAGHHICKMTGIIERTHIAGGGSDTTGSSWGMGPFSRLVNLNTNHRHSYRKNRRDRADRLWTTCPNGHAQCRRVAFVELMRTTTSGASFDLERLL